MRLYLIQAVRFSSEPFEECKGFDKYFDCKYMGAAEYECKMYNGELCNPLFLSIKEMTYEKDKYEFFESKKIKDFDNNNLIIYCKSKDFEEIENNILLLSKGKISLKRSCGFINYLKIKDKKEVKNDIFFSNFWWDIENNFFFFFGDEKKDIITTCFNEKYHELFPKKPSFLEKIKKYFKK